MSKWRIVVEIESDRESAIAFQSVIENEAGPYGDVYVDFPEKIEDPS